jgi:uncharacterized protein (TIGR03437 family)
MQAQVAVTGSAAPGLRNVTVTNPDGRTATATGLFEVVADQPPAVEITYPATQQIVRGSVKASASVSDDRGVQKVEFFLDGQFAAVDMDFPYQFAWNTTTSANGTHALVAKAYDTVDQTSTAQIIVNVNNGAVATVSTVSAASYSGSSLASESIVAAFGSNLATTTQLASTIPLPTSLAGTSVRVKDSAGTEQLAPLFFVASTQVNFLVPTGTANGAANITIISSDGSISAGTVQIAPVAPGLFSANASGQGVATGVALRIKANGSQSYEPISQFDQAQNKFVAIPLDLGPATDQLFLILYGTGIRFRSNLSSVTARIGGADAELLYAGHVEGLVGLDQVNMRVPRSLAGRGEVDVVITADGKTANPVRVSIGPVTAQTPTIQQFPVWTNYRDF